MNKMKKKHPKQGKFTLVKKSDPTTLILPFLTPIKIARYKRPVIFRVKKKQSL